MQDVKQLGYVGPVMPTAKTRNVGEKKNRSKDVTEEDQHSKQRHSKEDPDDRHVVDEYA